LGQPITAWAIGSAEVSARDAAKVRSWSGRDVVCILLAGSINGGDAYTLGRRERF
jgi:hypothetical protein